MCAFEKAIVFSIWCGLLYARRPRASPLIGTGSVDRARSRKGGGPVALGLTCGVSLFRTQTKQQAVRCYGW